MHPQLKEYFEGDFYEKNNIIICGSYDYCKYICRLRSRQPIKN